ncbi:MAG: hypothetical protein Kapaf2KO_04680 [Candidatus Kapaibacteriales bacterium]
MANTLTNLRKLEFSLDGVTGMSVEGINISNIKSVNDLSITDGIKALNAFKNKSLNTSFILNVRAKNPNGLQKDEHGVDATINNMVWDLFLDGNKTISGDLANPVTIKGDGAETVIPLRMSLDLLDYFGNRNYESLINLALNIGGQNADPTTVKLSADPTVSTKFGPIEYPGKINIEHMVTSR